MNYINRNSFKHHDTLCHRGYPKISVLFEIVLVCYLCKNISYNLMRLAVFHLKHIYSKAVDVSMVG